MSEDLFFQPDQITPEDHDLKVLEFGAEAYPDRRRIKVTFRLSGYRKSLGCTISLADQGGEELASANIVNIFLPDHEVTLHLPQGLADPGTCSLTLSLFTLEEVESTLEPGKVGAIQSHPVASETISLSLP